MMKRAKDKQISKETSITDLHESLIINILTCLPLQYIIRCCSVCKNWATLISQPYFIDIYDSSKKSPIQFLIVDSSDSMKPNNLFLAQLSEASCITKYSPPDLPVLTRTRFSMKFLDDLNLNPSSYQLIVFSTCKLSGFIAAYTHIEDDLSSKHHSCHVFNPITGHHILVEKTKTSTGFHRYPWQFCVLVCAQKSNQLKLLLLFPCYNHEEVMVEIQTIGTGSRRRIGRIPFYPLRRSFPTFANGLYHWIDCIKNVVYSFDPDEEIFEQIQIPPHVIKDLYGSNLGLLNGCLCICIKKFITHNIEFWVMGEDGNRESWTKKFDVDKDGWTTQFNLDNDGWTKKFDVFNDDWTKHYYVDNDGNDCWIDKFDVEDVDYDCWTKKYDVDNDGWTKKFDVENIFWTENIIEPLKCLESGEIVILCCPFKVICYNPSTGSCRCFKIAARKSPYRPVSYNIPLLRSVLPTSRYT